MATIGTRLFTWFRGEAVGSDVYGNRYYRQKGSRNSSIGSSVAARERRWVIYAGVTEASKVPAQWNGWLRHTLAEVPSDRVHRRPWEKEHIPNNTGTALAYHPPGSMLAGGQRDRATGDYEPWIPN